MLDNVYIQIKHNNTYSHNIMKYLLLTYNNVLLTIGDNTIVYLH